MREKSFALQTWRAGAALLALCAAALVHAGGEGAPSDWIMRMNRALATRNYDGVLMRQTGQRRQVLRIVHRVQDAHMDERVTEVSPVGPGPGREWVRNGNEWIAYDPLQRVALVQTRNRSYGFLTALNGLNGETARYYLITDGGPVHLDGRVAQRISLEPRDALRYGYRFWLDAKTALPLKTQLVTGSGEVIEDISFLSVELPDRIEDEQLKPEFDTSAFHWMRSDVPMYTPGLKTVLVPHAELMPAGFRVRHFTNPAEEAKAPGPRTRFIVSDGITWVSVFVAKAQHPAAPANSQDPRGKMRSIPGARADGVVVMGSLATYVAHPDGFDVTVVGEVPPATAKAIAEAVQPE